MFEISSFVLHIIAILCMLCDHIWATIYGAEWLTCIGRMAFPIFAFMIVEGYSYTKSFKKYILRLFIFALISEIPFNLMYANSIIYPFHQNVLWTFIIGLLFIKLFDKIKQKTKPLIFLISMIFLSFIACIIGYLLMVDYYGIGILMIFVFYFFREKTLKDFLFQLLLLGILNIEFLGGYYYEFTLFGITINIVQQGFALLSLIPIWLYKGKQGLHSKTIQYIFYGFYPLHMLILYIIYRFMS